MFRACWCCMQKVPDTVPDGHVGTRMLAATSFGWVAKRMDMLTGEKGCSGVSIKNIKTKGLRTLRDNMVEYICKRIAKKRSAAPTSQAVGPANSAIDDDGAERQTAPQAAVASQHKGDVRLGKEKEEVGVEATTEKGQEEAACEGSGKVSVDAGEGANITGVQETGEASGQQGPEDDVEQLRRENWLLKAENARLETLFREEKSRLDRFFVGIRGLIDKLQVLADQVAVSDRTAAKRLRDAMSAMSTTITCNITSSFDKAWKAMKSFAEKASAWLLDFDNPEGNMAYERAKAVSALADHVDGVVGEAKRGLEEYISQHLSAAQVNIATTVTHSFAVQPPPPPQPTPPAPTPTFPDELLKSFKADVLKAVTEATQQSFVASRMKIIIEMIGTVAPGRRGSSPSANDAEAAQRREADNRGPVGSKPAARSMVDQLKKKAGWKVIRSSHSKGDGSGGAEGGHADEVAAKVARPKGLPWVAERTHPQSSGGKSESDKEIPTARTAKDGGARTVKGPSVVVVGSTSIPRNPPAASSAPAGQSAFNNDGPSLAAPPAPVGPSAAMDEAKDAAVRGDGPCTNKLPAGGDALRNLLHRMEAHHMDAAPAKTARRSVTPQVAGTTSAAPPVAPLVAARPPSDPKSAVLRAQLGARTAPVPPMTQPEPGKSATPASVNAAAPTPDAAVADVAAEKGVRAALATGGQAAKDANIAAIQAHFEAPKRIVHAPALAIMDTAHVEPSATHGGSSAEPTTATDAVAERNERETEGET
ncbi:unnamed protein product [Closterium sp. NIES-65]|nr:unnamed protein product [Closterium sp. NIES-65]